MVETQNASTRLNTTGRPSHYETVGPKGGQIMLPKSQRPKCLLCKARAIPGVIWCRSHAEVTPKGRAAIAAYDAERTVEKQGRAEKRQAKTERREEVLRQVIADAPNIIARAAAKQRGKQEKFASLLSELQALPEAE